jgi:hypothetical protein
MAQAMLGYFGDRTTARRHAKAALRVVEARFSLARMLADYAGVYERALAAAGSPVPPAEGDPIDEQLHSAGTETAPN